MNIFHLSLLFIFYFNEATSQETEINDQFVALEIDTQDANKTIEENIIIENTSTNETKISSTEPSVPTIHPVPSEPTEDTIPFTTTICEAIKRPIVGFLSAPKVMGVLRNIGTCIVNGAMELVTYYFPAPLIPLIASAAGLVIPFEPIVMLREKMPVTSYRRAFTTAINSFLNTFDKFKRDDEEPDPYMARRFNRRFMDISSEKKEKVVK